MAWSVFGSCGLLGVGGERSAFLGGVVAAIGVVEVVGSGVAGVGGVVGVTVLTAVVGAIGKKHEFVTVNLSVNLSVLQEA